MLAVDWLKNNLNMERFGRFALVGALGTALDVGLMMFFIETARLPTLSANILSYSTGIVNNYFWNRRWTFSNRKTPGWIIQLFQFSLVSLVGLGLNSLLVVGLEGMAGLLPAKLLATGIVLLWNYNANRLWTFGGPVKAEVM
jgi:putative flippase GtrA